MVCPNQDVDTMSKNTHQQYASDQILRKIKKTNPSEGQIGLREQHRLFYSELGVNTYSCSALFVLRSDR